MQRLPSAEADPACVTGCPNEAIVYEDRDDGVKDVEEGKSDG